MKDLPGAVKGFKWVLGKKTGVTKAGQALLDRIDRYHPLEPPTEDETILETEREMKIALYSTQDEVQSQRD